MSPKSPSHEDLLNAEAHLWDADVRLSALIERLRILENFMPIAWEIDGSQVHAWAQDLGHVLSRTESELLPFFEESTHHTQVVDPIHFTKSKVHSVQLAF